MIDFILWYAVIFLLGWLIFPVTFRIFSKLKDRGFGLSKVLGLLIWAYIFWMMNMLGISQNTTGGLLLAGALLAAVSGLCLRNGRWIELRGWIREYWRVILFTELVFLVLFGMWTFIRATGPEVSGTEKPMELAFISSILRADQFPVQDPWLSGYSISYYYFGYVMAAMLIKITGTAAWVGFNLASALWFALTGTAAFSLVYSLISGLGGAKEYSKGKFPNLVWSLLGPLFILIVSNAEGFLEMLHSKGLFWKTAADGTMQSRFWSWLDIQEIVLPPASPYDWVPERPGIWWWRASRVLQDFTASGQSREIIDEFPFFSYYLADLHPHVLAMPFAILAIAFAYNVFLSFRSENQAGISLFEWAGEWFRNKTLPLQTLTIYPLLTNGYFWLAAFICGSLAFLNTWDFPIYVGLFGAVYTYHRYQTLGWKWSRLVEFITFCILAGVGGLIFFLPFYFGFASQAGGFLPSLFFFTRGTHFWVMFLPLLFPICCWLISLIHKGNIGMVVKRGIVFAAVVLGGLGFASYLFGWLGSVLPAVGNNLLMRGSFGGLGERLLQLGNLFYGIQGVTHAAEIWTSLKLRLLQPGTWLTTGIMVMLVWGLLSIRKKASPADEQTEQEMPAVSNSFVLMILLLGLGLVIFPEFFYLRDQFGWRINTIFKFYFQTWILWGIAAAAVSARLWKSLRNWKKAIFGIIWTPVILICLIYPFWGLEMKVKDAGFDSLSLDGALNIERYSPDDMEGIRWLLNAEDGVVLEAVGGSYSGYARISTFSGMPTVLGWPNHESQWRGGYSEIGSREEDIKQIYQSNNWDETLTLLQRYGVNYVYIGGLEKNTYNVNEEKFSRNLAIVYENQTVKIYAVPDTLLPVTE